MQQATIENILSGDLDAYDAVVRQYQGMLLGYAANRLLERENALLESGYVVDGLEPDTYRRPFRKNTVKLTKDVRVDSFLLQYNPVHTHESRNQKFQGELHFDRPIVALILHKDLLDSSDAQLTLPETDFRNIFRRGINDADVVTLSPDRRVLHVALDVKNGVDQIRVLVASGCI